MPSRPPKAYANIMILLIHVVLALASLILSVINYFRPSKPRLSISYSLATGTLASGVLLIVVSHASILRTCLTGITFFAVVSVLNELARKRLAIEISE